MKLIAAIGPWLLELVNPPPRNSLTFMQKMGRVVLVAVTLVTLCVVLALASSLFFYLWQRGREIAEGAPQVRNGITILVASVLMNAACIFALLQIKKFDRRLIPKSGNKR